SPSHGSTSNYRLSDKVGSYAVGVVEGSDVTPFDDAMIGKIIVHDEDRKKAIDKMKLALDELEVEGIITNHTLLEDIMNAEQFTSGQYTTNFLDEFNS